MATASRKADFKKCVSGWAGKLGVRVAGVYVRPMRAKWASCSSSGILSFNVELLELEPKLWNYVSVHELLHFDVPNHGKLWKSLMRAHVGDWEQCEQLLQKHAARQFDGLQKLMGRLEWDHRFDVKAERSRKAAH